MAGLLDHVGPWLMVLMRLSGLFVFAPILASTVIPAKVRILLAVVLAVAIYPTLPAAQQGAGVLRVDIFTLAALGFMEVALGVMIGFIALLPVVSVQLSGVIIGQQMGMSLAPVYNPALETESDPIGEMLLYIALAVFISVGGIEAMFLSVAQSFAHVPLAGTGAHGVTSGVVSGVGLMMGVLAAGFEVALRVTTPVMAILLVETIASAFVMKTMPQMNIMSIGFAVKIVLGLGAMVFGLWAMQSAVGDHVREVGRAMLRWTTGPMVPEPQPVPTPVPRAEPALDDGAGREPLSWAWPQGVTREEAAHG
jgi:flagellar biosynthetic protein FliR